MALTAPQKFVELLRKQDAYSEDEIQELRRLCFAMAEQNDYRRVAEFRASIELIDSVRKFDKASGELVSKTNKLTARIILLTYIAMGIGVLQLIETVISLFSHK